MMSIYISVLFVIVSCGAQELSSATELEDFNLTAVSIDMSSSTPESRIIGGSPTTIENYPFAVQLLYYGQLMCGGSLITRRHVLTAAHCVIDKYGNVASPIPFSVRVGASTLYVGGTVYEVSAIIAHEQYSIPTLYNNDVAVLLLSTRVLLGVRTQTVAIPIAGTTLPVNTSVITVGWGKTDALLDAVSSVLMEVSVRTVNRTECVVRYQLLQNLTGDLYQVNDNMICAGLLDVGGADACQGDSGGPLIYKGVVVGITSWGFGCAMPLFPGVYTKVSQYSSWINQTVLRYNSAHATSYNAVITLLIPLAFIVLSV